MKKLLFIFLLGQLFLLSFIFNQAIFDIYELNNLGDASLNGYIAEDFTANDLNKMYDALATDCLATDDCNLQLIKTPVASYNHFVYEIYHSQIHHIKHPISISEDTSFTYHQLTKEDFIDSNGVFYSDLSLKTVESLSKQLSFSIKPYKNDIAYAQIINNNLLNFGLLFILTQLVLFIYTFTRIKINAIKKMLGFSKFAMIRASIKDFLKFEAVIFAITFAVHLTYYWIAGKLQARYLIFLSLFLLVVILINLVLLLVTQISIRFIDIHELIKNKLYSNRTTMALYIVKIALILAISISISSFIKTYQTYKEQSNDLAKYALLEGYFTSNGYNYDEDSIARKNPKQIQKYGKSIKELYNFFDEKKQLYVNNANLLELLSPTYLQINDLKESDLYNSYEENYIVANERYFNEFMHIENENGKQLKKIHFSQPTILVPTKYKKEQATVKKSYIDNYNNLLNYDAYFGLPKDKKNEITDIEIVYIKNDQKSELLGQVIQGKSGSATIKNSIILIDTGVFDNLYYYDVLNSGDIFLKLKERETFSQALVQYDLDRLVNAGTLLTPYMDKVHFTQFILNNLFVFTILFLITLVFIMYISNFVDIISNSKRYSVQVIHGFSIKKIFKSQFIVWLILLLALFLKFFIEFNVVIYVSMLVFDFLMLLYLFKKEIQFNIQKVIKGG